MDRRLIIVAGLLTALPTAAPAEAPVNLFAATELNAAPSGHFVVVAQINGRDIKVMVDTGATSVALSYEDAKAVGLRPGSLKYDVPVATANGMTKAARVKLRKVEVDGVKVNDVDGLVLPEGVMRGSLLGMSYLGRLDSFKVEDGVLYLKN
jgi:aspartyl protease family protein